MPRLTSCNASGPNLLSAFFERVLGLNSIGIVILSSAFFLIGCGSDDPVTTADVDSDGDGILDEQEILNGTNKNNPCDPKPISGYMGFDPNNTVWLNADCDVDGISNAQELTDNTDPFVNETKDTDGDGIPDFQETANGTDKDNPCDPLQNGEYTGYNTASTIWSNSDCDGDGFSNGDEVASSTNPYIDDTVYAVADFMPKLSELQLFKGNLADLATNPTTHEYSLVTPLYSDYAYKFRTISLPEGGQMVYHGQGLLEFPDNTVISKTFYYLNDERNPSLGKKLIETRLLIKTNGAWQMGNYLWNEEQTEAVLSNNAPVVTVDWIDMDGNSRSVDYKVPFSINCTQCHNVNDTSIPIGPKARNLNRMVEGKNQLQLFIEKGLLADAPELSQIEMLPDWSDNAFTLGERTRAYMDVNCAHCHQPGGLHGSSVPDRPDLRFETSFNESHIFEFREDIRNRVATSPAFGPSMPLSGITQLHAEGVQLIHDYIDSL